MKRQGKNEAAVDPFHITPWLARKSKPQPTGIFSVPAPAPELSQLVEAEIWSEIRELAGCMNTCHV